jgi:hypothetical protein
MVTKKINRYKQNIKIRHVKNSKLRHILKTKHKKANMILKNKKLHSYSKISLLNLIICRNNINRNNKQ